MTGARAAGTALLGVVLAAGTGMPAEAGLSYLAFGDSITRGVCDSGVGVCPTTGTCDLAEGDMGYPMRLANTLTDCTLNPLNPANCPTACCVTNAGLSGETTAQMITRIQTFPPATYDVAILMGGTNDIFNFVSANTVRNNIATIDGHAVAKDMDPMLSSIIHFRDDVAGPYAAAVSSLRTLLMTSATNRNRLFADPWTPLCAGAFCFDQNYYQPGTPDPVGHPNGCGYDILEGVFSTAILSETIPGVPPLTSPSDGGDITDTTPTLSWTKSSNARWHEVQIDNGGTWDDFFQVADSACSGADTSCAVTAPALAAGSHTWRVRGRNPHDYGGWSTTFSFDLYTTLPPVPTPSSPSGDLYAQPASFDWSDEGLPPNGATDYELEVAGPVPFSGAVSPTCDGVTCTVAPPVVFTGGDYTWQVLSENPIGKSALSGGLAFRFIDTVPGTANQTYPAGDETFDTTPLLRWDEVDTAEDYLVAVRDSMNSLVYNSGFVSKDTLCNSPCEIETGTTLTPGDYTWTVTARNPVGPGPPSASQSFTVLDCSAFPDLSLPAQTVSGTVTEKACVNLTAGALGTYTIEGPSGDATFHAGGTIKLDNGFEVEPGGTFTAITDP